MPFNVISAVLDTDHSFHDGTLRTNADIRGCHDSHFYVYLLNASLILR